jgi:hypothetical protein
MIPQYRGELDPLQSLDHFVRKRAVADDVPGAKDAIDALVLDPLQHDL